MRTIWRKNPVMVTCDVDGVVDDVRLVECCVSQVPGMSRTMVVSDSSGIQVSTDICVELVLRSSARIARPGLLFR